MLVESEYRRRRGALHAFSDDSQAPERPAEIFALLTDLGASCQAQDLVGSQVGKQASFASSSRTSSRRWCFDLWISVVSKLGATNQGWRMDDCELNYLSAIRALALNILLSLLLTTKKEHV